MSEIALGQLVWFVLGAALGALAAVNWFAWRERRRAPRIDWESIKNGIAADDRIRNQVLVNWDLINSALEGAGYVAVPKDSFVRH